MMSNLGAFVMSCHGNEITTARENNRHNAFVLLCVAPSIVIRFRSPIAWNSRQVSYFPYSGNIVGRMYWKRRHGLKMASQLFTEEATSWTGVRKAINIQLNQRNVPIHCAFVKEMGCSLWPLMHAVVMVLWWKSSWIANATVECHWHQIGGATST